MCLTNMREAAFRMAEESKKLGCKVIVSSSDAADHYEKYFNHDVDYVVRGEGEETLKELLSALEKNQDVSKVQGLAFRKNGQTELHPSRAVIRDLDTLPLPAWDLVDIESYRKIWLQHHGYFSLNLATTRGCPFKCNWCAKPIYGNRYTSRSPSHVVGEIELLLKNYSPDYFWMCDDIFGLKPGWVQEFNALLSERNKNPVQNSIPGGLAASGRYSGCACAIRCRHHLGWSGIWLSENSGCHGQGHESGRNL